MLLKDPRVDVTLEDNWDCNPLRQASFHGYHKVIEWFIASGRDLGVIQNKKGKNGMAQSTRPSKLLERRAIQKLCHCLKDS